jgi:hypothetical protein
VPSSSYRFRPFRSACSVFVRGNDEQEPQRCADSLHVNFLLVRLRPDPGCWTLLWRRLPVRHGGRQRPVQTRRSPETPKRLRAGSSETRRCANSIRIYIGAAEHRSTERARAASHNEIASRIRASSTDDRGSYRRANSSSTRRERRSQILAVPRDRRIFRAPDPAPQQRSKFRRWFRRGELSRGRPAGLLNFLARMMRFMRRDHFLRDFVRHIIVMRKFHRITPAPLRQRNQFIRVAEHF